MKPNFKQLDLIPAIIQDSRTGKVLMMGYMNDPAYEQTLTTGRVTFFSRSRQTLWTKGETSGNYLELQEMIMDCDQDTILVKAIPSGPVCHTGSDTCFNEKNSIGEDFLFHLEQIILDRIHRPSKNSYTTKLLDAGRKKIAQKVGEEASEVIIEGIGDSPERLADETADLLYHTLVLLAANQVPLQEVMDTLRNRHRIKPGKSF